ncbi:ABC transporter permease/substrate-binding protein [Leuconostoc lactis]|uniref:ABC transporter permease/substrate-binding protein n=1 Tax=Leuconostoc lactis TaxID=1246 RepID=UPI0006DD2BB5|nr:ABC transporter permease/substrate-binding protein [Leuconostoc lactis]KQB81093.1 glycine/betaine ABC transporter permease [Leuconostoc lactis]QEA47554.1 ABC transporter permease/substrate-binding protein [Leuconostoc lactis]HBP98143.1 glycine/betaine ABC transporter permease [Leuconostoc lactis]
MWQTLMTRHDQFVTALWQHIQLTVAALVIAALIAIPLAIWAENHRRYAEWLLQLTGLFQTLPSLAVLGLLIPVVGIGTPAALIALVIYALLPIFQNTYLGLTEVDQGVLDGGRALGLSRRQILRRIQLPLAQPSIMAGLRTAVVLIIGTATLAALIGAGGLGDFILLGINRNNTNLILIGAFASAALALIGSFGVQWLAKLQHTWRRIVLISLSVLFIGGSVAPLLPQKQAPQTITIAGKLGSEPEILIHMYAALIKQSQPETRVILKPNFGVTTFLYEALTSKKIDLYPEFTGTITATLAKPPVTLPVGADAQTTYLAAKKVAQAQQLTMTQPMQFNDTYGIAVPQNLAKQYHLTTIGDLQHLPHAKAGMTAEFLDRPDGMPAIEQTYGLNVPKVSLDPALRYQAVREQQVSVVDAYTTDSQIKQYHLKVLADDRHVFPVYQGVGLMRSDFAKNHPEIVRAVNQLAGHITNEEMQAMNYAVNVDHQSAEQVARNYLKAHKLLK